MTNRNSALNAECGNEPFLLKPAAKSYIWGGERLNKEFNKNIPLSPVAETWECSTHPDGPSMVDTGEHMGLTLSQVLAAHPEYLGTHPKTKGELPILIKLIDAKQDLSVQVHPDDLYAKEHENGKLGKTEMWYVLDVQPGASLIYGLNNDVDRDTLRKSIYDGLIEKFLQRVAVNKDDVFFVEAGTIHAVGAGALIAEIQESSNLTYRLYDYNRVDKDGNARELHIEKALDTAKLKASTSPRQPMRLLKYRPGCASELICRCRYFQVNRMLLNTELGNFAVEYQADSSSFRALLCTEGQGYIQYDTEKSLEFVKGSCIFVPANSARLEIRGKAQLLDVRG